MKLGGQSQAPGDLASGEKPGTNLQEATWDIGPISTGVEKRQSLVPYQGSNYKPSSTWQVAIEFTLSQPLDSI